MFIQEAAPEELTHPQLGHGVFPKHCRGWGLHSEVCWVGLGLLAKVPGRIGCVKGALINGWFGGVDFVQIIRVWEYSTRKRSACVRRFILSSSSW